MSLLRHAFAIVVLPLTVAVIVPMWLARKYDVAFTPPVNARAYFQ